VSDLTGQVGLVTGGGSGIGAAIARALVAAGARVCVTGRREDALRRTVASFPAGSAVACAGDVSAEPDARRMVQAASALGDGRLHILVNNAAAPINGTIETVDLADWHSALAVNLTGPMLVTRCALPALRAAGRSSVVNVSSVAALAGNPGITPYATTKAALLALTRQCALDFGADGIRVNAICPGWVRTEMSEQQMDGLAARRGGDREEAFAAVSAHQPIRRVADPSEIAEAVVFLASERAGFITGAVLPIDGGSTAVGPLGEILAPPPRRRRVARRDNI
jgi:NAD(P)-dependent dehydrogenase (short-subunit alcohol dehydrogenase family)